MSVQRGDLQPNAPDKALPRHQSAQSTGGRCGRHYSRRPAREAWWQRPTDCSGTGAGCRWSRSMGRGPLVA
eukprot:2255104-Prymnesium_polylepis.2